MTTEEKEAEQQTLARFIAKLRVITTDAYNAIPEPLRKQADRANLKGHYDEEWPTPRPIEVRIFLTCKEVLDRARELLETLLAEDRPPDLTLRKVKRQQ